MSQLKNALRGLLVEMQVERERVAAEQREQQCRQVKTRKTMMYIFVVVLMVLILIALVYCACRLNSLCGVMAGTSSVPAAAAPARMGVLGGGPMPVYRAPAPAPSAPSMAMPSLGLDAGTPAGALFSGAGLS